MADCAGRRILVSGTYRGDRVHQRMAYMVETRLPSGMGEHFGYHGRWISRDSILPTDLDDISLEACWKLEHSDDADPNAWQFCLGRKSRG